jgi:predicted dehydrogenase
MLEQIAEQAPTKIAVGIIGLGRSGWGIHALNCEKHPHFRVTAVTDPSPERCQEAIERFGCQAYATPHGLLADQDVELVIVATPSHTHGELTIEALKAGKDVLVEKPMANDAIEARQMAECAKSSGQKLIAFQVRRTHSDYLKVREIVDSGVLGPLHLIKLNVYSYQRRSDWQTLRKFSGGILNNLGAHFIDQALSLAGGEWRDLFVDMRHLVSAGDADDHVKVVFRGKDDVVVDVELSAAAATATPPPHWTILGKYGALTGSLTHFEWRYYDPKAVPEVTVNASTPDRAYPPPEALPWVEHSIVIEDHDARRIFYDRLYAYLRQGGPSPAPTEEIEQLTALFDRCRQRTGF